MKLTKLASLALLASATFNSWAQINTTDLEEVINTSMARFDVPGMAVAVVQDDKVVFAKGFGISNLNTNAKVNKDTLFGIASNTKAFTSAALAKLVDEGKLSWDDRV
ncbi:MAG: serine hydrolase domain-containing protein, partial [Pseudomonadota bacterium]|nr:serine hydrolase domain-containing protein [Pseudomonadota bacterium]